MTGTHWVVRWRGVEEECALEYMGMEPRSRTFLSKILWLMLCWLWYSYGCFPFSFCEPSSSEAL
jgi:hypothetical protein